jgi:nicotinate-nucleotide pyrophosphorylase (carboxylating)
MDRQQLIDLAYRRGANLHVGNPEYVKILRRFTVRAVEEDLGEAGDITVLSVLRGNIERRAKVIAKETGILAGLEEASWFYNQYGIRVNQVKRDGDWVEKGDLIFELEGREFKLLETERVGLNLIQRMSGIASLTNHLVRKCQPLLVAATRKTHWGSLDNKAVSVGGGGTHRLGLWESILIKENHLASLAQEGDFDVIEEALDRAWHNRDKAVFIEIEVVSSDDALEAAGHFVRLLEDSDEVKPCVVMLDNFSPNDAAETVSLLKERRYYERVLIEASGGITPENILAYRDAGVDVVSMGYLTHSPRALDISQLIEDN